MRAGSGGGHVRGLDEGHLEGMWGGVCAAGRRRRDPRPRLPFPASVRRSLRPPLPAWYFCNGIIWLGTAGQVQQVASTDGLASVAGRISGAVRRMDDELVR